MKTKIPVILGSLLALSGNDSITQLSLSANENVVSRTAMRVSGLNYANKYYSKTNNGQFSDFPSFIANGDKSIDKIIETARRSMSKMAGANYVNLYPLSGIHAMLMSIVALTNPGDTVLSLPPGIMGHFATRDIVESIGRQSLIIPVVGDQIDTVKLKVMVDERQISLVYLDVMSFTDIISVKAIRKAVGSRVKIVFDASHSLGLILGKQLPNPLKEGADVMCANTHKTFPGPHRGVIFAKKKSLGAVIEQKTAAKLYSSTHFGALLSMVVTVFEMEAFGKKYAKQVCENAQMLGLALSRYGVAVAHIKGTVQFTKNHQLHLPYETRESAVIGLERLRENNIIAHMCYNNQTGYFIRLGVQEITRRGMIKEDMDELAQVVSSALKGHDTTEQTTHLLRNLQSIHYSYDQ